MPADPEPDGRVVIISAQPGLGYKVTVSPPPPSGDVFRTFHLKIDAFSFARELWTKYRCGLEDHSVWRGPYKQTRIDKSREKYFFRLN